MQSPLYILGLSFFYHDAAAALLKDGVVVAAAQEERFTRKKHDPGFPRNAVRYCLEAGGISANDLAYVVFYDKPILTFERLLQTYLANWPRGLRSFLKAMQVWLKDKLWVERRIAKELSYDGEILFTEHHYAHAASAYYFAPVEDAVVVTMDGVGEWDTTTLGYGRGNRVLLTERIAFPHSLGLLYSALTYYLGFTVNSAEYKVMGLAPYGDPAPYLEKMRKLIAMENDGSYTLDHSYFAYEYGETMTNRRFDELFGGPPRKPDEPLTKRHKDIAAALQKITEEAVLAIAKEAKRRHPSENICLAGGVALNCVANGKILESGLFKNVFVQPAAGDAGGAVGAACYLYYDVLKNPKRGSAMPSVYLGPAYGETEIEAALAKAERAGAGKIRFEKLGEKELLSRTAKRLAENAVVGWFEGRMEFGPRALGNRSILADPRRKENWQRVNLKIKFRESFRPFAPAVLRERAEEYFSLRGHPSPHMLLVAPVKSPDIPAVTHVDDSARVQTVAREENPLFHGLLAAFAERTGCPVLVNTSFNVRGEPIVMSPEDALACFANTDMDVLVLGPFLLEKSENPGLAALREGNYLSRFGLD